MLGIKTGTFADNFDGYIFLQSLQDEVRDIPLYELYTDEFVEEIKRRFKIAGLEKEKWFGVENKHLTKDVLFDYLNKKSITQNSHFFRMTFPHYPQLDAMDCGSTCLRMISKYYGKSYSNQFLRERSFITREGVSMLGISDAAESIGFRTMGAKIPLKKLLEAPLPCILHWNQKHANSAISYQSSITTQFSFFNLC